MATSATHTDSETDAEASSPNLDYNFNLLLGNSLKNKSYKPEELNRMILNQLTSSKSDDVDYSSLHHRMSSETLTNAKKKTKKATFLFAYLLDRWARVPGIRDSDTLIQQVFTSKHEIQEVIPDIIQFLQSRPEKPTKTRCNNYPHLEIGLKKNMKGKLFSSCRDCRSEKPCHFNIITEDDIKALEGEFLQWKKTNKQNRPAKKQGDVKPPKKDRTSLLPEPDTSTESVGDVKPPKKDRTSLLPEPDTSTESVGSNSSTEHTMLSDSDLSNIVSFIDGHAAKWLKIGIGLGFKHCDLETIQADGAKQNNHFVAMIAEWLQWAPSDGHGHRYATVQSLQSALRSAKLGVIAEKFDGYVPIKPAETNAQI